MSAVLSDTLLNQRAEEIMLADVDEYAEWISAHCYRKPPVELMFVSRDPVALQLLVDQADVPKLVAMTRYPRADVVWAAQSELNRRQLADERLFKLAQEKAGEES
ncbi:hypothetical protein [Methylibium sp. T29]|uniref:hypothetical protein n=1 Tax=Methylibium sp. T29 TaxID=1430884 RepID=UPI0003F40689|nr:hypothetical protein [Methylibium sp. T29]EWS53324.1 hypothetical protein X551_03897 [Methylibium sp. T29]